MLSAEAHIVATDGRIEVDSNGFPLVEVRFLGQFSDAAFDAYLEDVTTLLERRRRYALVLDATRSGRPSAAQRKKQASWMQRHRAEIAEHCLGIAMVIRSPLVRGALTAILWMAPTPAEHVVVSTRLEALEWARARLGR